ncbi:response regulator [Xylophilus rhododendri]|uniref:histidine kinase n=1 Tax=Xylophilus rhododendri TaxID=2697032 RepID=A0A857J332_9BURK|nr:hybrid sensor histidine kinase/response regulator [Xylophilus rhododendri]QHI97539.1 response regulator [Xylophilus rhododendri]
MSNSPETPSSASGTAAGRSASAVLRDLMGLMALPALWVGRDAATVLRLMAEAIETVVPLDTIYIDVPNVEDGQAFTRLRISGLQATPQQALDWQDTLAAIRRMSITATPSVQATPLGPLRMIRLSMGFSGSQGSVWFGSRGPAFPDVHQSACLRAVATLAATGLEAAAIDRERARASRVKDEFLAMLGHELRNPLAPIFMALELLKRQAGGASLGRPYEIIERQARHLSRLVDDLMDIGRLTNRKFELHKEPVSIRLCLQSAIEAVGPLVEARQQRLDVGLPSAEVLVFGDATRLTQVFANILTNAAKYTHLQGHIVLRSEVTDGRLRVAVRDDGPGISAELMPRLFGVFEQGSSTIDRAGGGLGIGLALVKSFVESHEGTVDVRSEGVGKGAEFSVVLPTMDALAALPAAPATPEPAPRSPARRRMMLVDDNTDAAELLAAVLADEGFEVRVSADPFEALALAEEFRPEIAILDVGLPGMSGHELAVALRGAREPEALRLVALSGYGQPMDRSQSLAAGFETHFVKPVSYPDLLAHLHKT